MLSAKELSVAFSWTVRQLGTQRVKTDYGEGHRCLGLHQASPDSQLCLAVLSGCSIFFSPFLPSAADILCRSPRWHVLHQALSSSPPGWTHPLSSDSITSFSSDSRIPSATVSPTVSVSPSSVLTSPLHPWPHHSSLPLCSHTDACYCPHMPPHMPPPTAD